MLDEMKQLQGARVFITGGTGFFGCWFLESVLDARKSGVDVRVTVLSRNPKAFAEKYPRLVSDSSAVQFVSGDVRSFQFPDGQFSHVIHAATAAADASSAGHDQEIRETILDGTRHTLECAQQSGASRFLFVSSGAVYGAQPSEITHISEDYEGAPSTAYGLGKRDAEKLCFQESGLEAVSARCFAFAGPYMPLEGPFALGNFIRDGLAGGPIRLNGDGTPYRSYLYAGDLMTWLWTILTKGRAGQAYNVGSESDAPILEFAHRTARCFSPPVEVQVARTAVAGAAPARYVPSTRRARDELGLRETVGFEESVQRTLKWIRTGQLER